MGLDIFCFKEQHRSLNHKVDLVINETIEMVASALWFEFCQSGVVVDANYLC